MFINKNNDKDCSVMMIKEKKKVMEIDMRM